jgi:hypothetical protein
LPSKCAQRLQGHEKTLAALHENWELVIELNIDMPIVGTSSLEKQIDASVAESLQGDKFTFNGCTFLKRRNQQDLEEARVEKRVKVESEVGLSCKSFNENGVDPTVPFGGVEGCQDTSVDYELTKGKDDMTPFVQGYENSTPVGNGTDLSDLLRDLDDSSDSEDVDDDEFEGDQSSWPSLEADPRDKLTGKSNVNETEVQAQAPLIEPIVNAVDIFSEQEKRNDIGTEVQAHAHETKRKEKPSPEIIMLDSDSDDDDDDLGMFDHLDEVLQLKTTVKSEPGGLRQVPNESSQLANAVKVEHGRTRQVPNGSLELEISVKIEHGSTRQVPHNMQSPGFQAGTMQNILTAEQQQPGTMLQVRIVNGKLEPYLARIPVIPQNAIRMPMFPFGGNLLHPGIRQAFSLPYLYPSGCSTRSALNNGMFTVHIVPPYAFAFQCSIQHCSEIFHFMLLDCAQEATSSGKQAGRSHGLNSSTTSSPVPSLGERAGPNRGLNPSTTPKAVPSGDQPGPRHAWNSPSTSAVVPFYSGK